MLPGDNVNADALVRKVGSGRRGARSCTSTTIFYLGTRAEPRMAKFEALPTQHRWARDYKWLRPQTFARSPFRTTLNMDGDAVPCGARLVEAFRAFTKSQAAVAGLWHVDKAYSGLNTGFMAWDRDKAAPPRGVGRRHAQRHPGERHRQPRPAGVRRGAGRDARRVRPALLGGGTFATPSAAARDVRLRIDVPVGQLLGRPPRLGPEVQQGRHRQRRQGGRRVEVETSPPANATTQYSFLVIVEVLLVCLANTHHEGRATRPLRHASSRDYYDVPESSSLAKFLCVVVESGSSSVLRRC